MPLNNEELFVKRLIDLTNDDKLVWNPSSFSKYSDEIENSHKGVRIFETQSLNNVFPKKENSFSRSFIVYEIKNVLFHTDLEEYYESNSVTLVLLNNNVIERSFNSTTISDEILDELIESVSNKTYKTDEFIQSLMNEET